MKTTSKPMVKWVPAEIMIMRQCAGSMTAKNIGRLIGRTASAIRAKAREQQIKLQLHGDHHQSAKYRHEDIELARSLHVEGISRKDIAMKLEMPLSAVNQYVYFDRRVSA
ncbi:DNA-binding protein [Enterobacter soli]|uniref:DNA-binding protein n=1 Tax=Enterobacter soli TaxID=885040 RepID=UPI002F41319C